MRTWWLSLAASESRNPGGISCGLGLQAERCHMRVAVMAAGAVGGYFGGRMAAARHDVVFIARGTHRDAIRGKASRSRARSSISISKMSHWGKLARTPSFVISVSRGLFGQEACKGLFSLFGCIRHAFKKAGRAFYQPRTTGAIDFPPPGLRGTPSSLHDERIVGRVRIFKLCRYFGPVDIRPSGTSLGTSEPSSKASWRSRPPPVI